MTADIIGIFGRPFIDLEWLATPEKLAELDREITFGLARVPHDFTGGTLKWMGVVAPWIMDDGYRDAADAIAEMSPEAYEDFLRLSPKTRSMDPLAPVRPAFGDETDLPFSKAQMRYLAIAHGAYFPWQVCVHLLENDTWDDLSSGQGKSFTKLALRHFQKTVAWIGTLPFVEIGRVVIFGVNANDHAPLHRDSEPGKALVVPHCISVDPRGNKGFYLQSGPSAPPVVVDKKVYWFNDMDYHGVSSSPFFRYSIRIDGRFEPSFLRAIEERGRARTAVGRSARTRPGGGSR